MYFIIPHVTRFIGLLSSGFVPTSADPHAALETQDNYIEGISKKWRKDALLPVQSENTELVDEPPESSSNLTQNLPPEILGHIFICCLPELSAAPNSAARDLAPQLLIQVCKRWQTVAAGTPQLWTTLGLHGLCHVDPISLISTALRRSGALPLDIYIDPLTWSYAPRRVVPRAAQLLARALHRCRTLHTSNFPALLEHLLPAGSCAAAPHLRDLRIAAAPKSAGHTLRGRLAAPALAALDICDPAATLRALRVGADGRSVRHVRWDGSHAARPAHASVTHLAALLRACPRLETCAVVRPSAAAAAADADGSRAAIGLPHLHRLSLLGTAPRDIVPLLRRLDVPALEHVRLQVEPTMSSGLACILDALFPDAAAAPLKELHVVALCESLPLVAPLPFPHLTRLCLCAGEGGWCGHFSGGY